MSARGEAPAPLATDHLIERVARALETAPAGPHVVFTPAGTVDPLALLAPGADAFLWIDRDERRMAGRGEVIGIHAVDEDPLRQTRELSRWAALATSALEVDPAPIRFFGRAAFNEAETQDADGRAITASFLLPEVAWIDDGDSHARLQLAVSEADADFARDRLLDELRSIAEPAVERALPHVHGDLGGGGDRARWRALVESALALIESGAASKIVCARTVRLRVDDVVDAAALARSMTAAEGTYRYLVRSGDAVFAGASPERLIEKRADIVRTEAVAGTAAIGHRSTPLEQREKDRREHLAVVLAIEEALALHTLALEHAEEPVVRQVGRVLHLVTPFEGRVDPATHVLDLAATLHPTPAVAGTPRDVALEFLAKHEDIERGWYAGPVGWFDLNGDGELAVALRCVRIEGTALDLFAGAGIVAGSDPDAEFDETVLKMRSTLASLGFELSA